MRALGSLLVTLSTFLLLGLIGIILLMGWSIGLGWLLTRLLPVLSLFEASLLIMLASIAIAFLGSKIMSMPVPAIEPDEEFEDLEESPIPAERFYKGTAGMTGEALFRYRMANGIYLDIEYEPGVSRMMSASQLEELAIRLADIAVAVLKRRGKHARRIVLTAPALAKEMEKKGQRPYDDDILATAVESINEQLFFDLDLADIVRQKRWDEPMAEWFTP